MGVAWRSGWGSAWLSTVRTAGVAALGVAALGLAGLGLAAPAAAQSTATHQNEQITVTLTPDVLRAKPGEPVTITLEQVMAPGWHTYWRNGGDGGFPTTIEWRTPDGVTVSDIEWPTPLRFAFEGFWSYGFKDRALLPSTITLPADWPAGRPAPIEASVSWLICKDVCMPQQAELSLTLQTAPVAVASADGGAMLLEARASQPTPIAAEAAYAVVDGVGDAADAEAGFTLAVRHEALADPALEDLYFFPNDRTVLDHSAPQRVTRYEGGLLFETASQPRVVAGEDPPARLEGVITAVDRSGPEPTRLAVVVTASLGGEALRTGALGAVVAVAQSGGSGGGSGGGAVEGSAAGQSAGAAASGGLPVLWLLAIAALGGLILNVMPCVFPVLALKALKIAKQSGAARAERLTSGGAYAAGVMTSFVGLGVALLALRAGGEGVGWGFQLQSPAVIAGLAALLFLVGLNLSGVFEVGGGRLMGLGSGLAGRGGVAGSYFTGVLAAVVAAPCVGPFLSVAVGAALSAPNAATAMAIFMGMGLGFAAPIVALSLAPGLAARLPKPGPWMVRFRQILAFPMYLSVVWLLYVLSVQLADRPDAVFWLMAGLVCLAFAVWLFSAALRLDALRSRLARGSAAAVAALALLGAGASFRPALGLVDDRAAVASEPYDATQLDAHLANGRPVFVTLTAAWCVTCKWNERTVLAGDGFRTALADAGAVYMVGDWTSYDAEITAFLQRFGFGGVPFYVYFPADGGEPTVLPPAIRLSDVRAAVDA